MRLISVVTIVRNNSAGLNKTRASIAEQSFRDLEWIVVDGASTDGTAELAASLSENDCVAISEPDDGIFDAMNKGLERATGKFVLFLNAGDILANSGVLADVSRELTEDIDFLYGDSLEAFGGGRLIYKAAKGHERVNYGMFACHQTMYFRRSVIGAQRYDPRFRIAGDYCFTAEFLQKHPRIRRVDAALCVFDLTGASNINRGRGRQENWRVQKEVLGLSLLRRCAFRTAYLLSSLLAVRMPRLYAALRFRSPDGN